MKVTIYPPLALNQVGRRDNNEDSVQPPVGMATEQDRVFLVCDGVGGNAKGEVASRLVCDGVGRYFKMYPGASNTQTIHTALRAVEQEIDTYLSGIADAKGMATTLTLLHLHEGGATVAHVGDSRVHQIRQGRILFQTDDHKLVNEWLKLGILTPEQAADHPQRNVITRAVRGRSVKPAQADVQVLTDIRSGDYFFLCTDGILEALTSESIADILSQSTPDAEKMAIIHKRCQGVCLDNFSAYLIHIQSVEGKAEVIPEPAVLVAAQVVPSPVQPQFSPTKPVAAANQSNQSSAPSQKKQSWLDKLSRQLGLNSVQILLIGSMLLVTGLLTIRYFLSGQKRPKPTIHHLPNRPAIPMKPRQTSLQGLLMCLLLLTQTISFGKPAINRPGQTYAVVAAIADYKYGTQNDLKQTVNDARKFYSFLRSPVGGSIPSNHIRFLIDSHASRAEILKQLQYMFSFARPEDRVIFYFSGHGAPGVFVPYDLDVTSQQTIRQTVLTHAEVKAMFKKCRARTKLCIADACHSGSITQPTNQGSGSSNGNGFSDNKTGVMVLMSSRGDETSMETPELRQGVFSYYLIKAMQGEADGNRNQVVTARELFSYVSKNVSAYATKRRAKQHPIAYGRFSDDMPVAYIN